MDFEAFKGMGNTYDLILDATDNLPVRGEIDKYAKATRYTLDLCQCRRV